MKRVGSGETLGLEFAEAGALSEKLEVTGVRRNGHDEIHSISIGKCSSVRDHHNEATVSFKETKAGAQSGIQQMATARRERYTSRAQSRRCLRADDSRPARLSPRRVFGRLDYASIFVLIAGSSTPTYAILFHGWFRWMGLAFIWTLAIAGVVVKTVFYNDIGHSVSIALYLFMGWSGAIAGFIAWRRYGNRFVAPLFAGAVAYTLGTLFEANATQYLFWTGVVQSHELWHLAVLLGAAFHWAFIYQFASGILPPLIDRTLAPTRRDGDWSRCSDDDAA